MRTLFPDITSVADALKQLKRHDRMVQNFYDDPMSDECGCTSDFQEDFDRRESKILMYLVNHAPDGSAERQLGLDRMEKFFP